MNISGKLLLLFAILKLMCAYEQPHIVIVIADDLGWSDVSLHKISKIRTPFIDQLAQTGIRFTNHYAQPLCSPSRATLLTGKYALRLGGGLDRSVFLPAQNAGLPTKEKLLSQHLQDIGYQTALIGKWHLGFSTWAHTPTSRGFNKFFGFYTGAIDYFKHNQTDGACQAAGYKSSFLDFRNQTKPFRKCIGKYSTNIFNEKAQELLAKHNRTRPLLLMMSYQNVHSPLQAPESYIKKYDGIISQNKRKVYAAMTTHLDDSVRMLKGSLQKYGMWKDTLFLFLSDNGGDPTEGGYNWPLRGVKGSLWEGGIKSFSFLSGGFLSKVKLKTGKTLDNLIHISDWMPTLLHAAKGNKPGIDDIDGIDIWPLLQGKADAPRRYLVHNINKFSYAVRYGDWKLISEVDVGWATPPDISVIDKSENTKRPIDAATFNTTFNDGSLPRISDGLFNIQIDPFEKVDLSQQHPRILHKLKLLLNRYKKQVVESYVPYACNKRALQQAQRENAWSPFIHGTVKKL